MRNTVIEKPVEKKKKKQRKPWDRKPNWALRQERLKDLVYVRDFPLEIRIKPTAHKQYCFVCRELMEKGERQIVLDAGMWHCYGDNSFKSFQGNRIKISGDYSNYPQQYFKRHVYLHTTCLSCLLNKMFEKAGLNLMPECEKCRNRFNCYTNNSNLQDKIDHPWGGKTYIPSRPCSEVDEDV